MAVNEIQKFPNESEPRKGLANPDIRYHLAPKDFKLLGFPDATWEHSKTSIQGGGGKRMRWRLPDGKILEWDRQHGTVEMFNRQGTKHLGEFNPNTGEQLKESKPGRRTTK